MHTLLLSALALLICLPFIAASYELHRTWLSSNVAAFASVGVHHSFLGNLSYFLCLLPVVMSPALFSIFVLSILVFRRCEYDCLLPLIVSTAGGLCLTCTSMGTDLEMRYVVPFLICPAIFSAFLLEKLIRSQNYIARTAAGAIVILIVITYFDFSFSPYPSGLKPLPWVTGSFATTHKGDPNRYGFNEWGYPLAMDTIDGVEEGKPINLIIRRIIHPYTRVPFDYF